MQKLSWMVIAWLGWMWALGAGGCAHRPVGNGALRDVPLAVDEAMAAQVRAIGQSCVDEYGIVGLSIGIAIDGEIVFADGFGHADASRAVPANAETVYDIASIGKHFTSAAILLLVERGDLSLEARVRTLVPELPAHFPDATIDQLLRHTSGFVSGEVDEQDPPDFYARPRYGLELLNDVELQTGKTLFEPGETYVYSNAGYLVLGLVVEAASGMRYDRFVRQHVLKPLEPHAMLVCEYDDLPRGSQRVHRTQEGVAPVPFIDMTAWSGQGSICSNVIDLLRWSDALGDGKVISRRSLELLRKPSVVRGDVASAEVPYGMGQRIGSLAGYHKVGHTGTFTGGSAVLFDYPDVGLEIAVLSNTNGDGVPHAHVIEREIAKLLLEIEPVDVNAQRKPLSDEKRRAIEGSYTHGRVLEARTDGDELVVIRNGEEIERLIHIGDLRFRRADDPDVFQWFLLDGEQAGWWVYSISGSYMEVLRRE